jgi:dihydrofolate reductase
MKLKTLGTMTPEICTAASGVPVSASARMAYELRAYAIVSDDGMIADAAGAMPEQLKNDADWAHFQAELALAQLVLIGRRSHEASPSRRARPRLVVSGAVAALERRPNAWWWNPRAMPLQRVLETVLPEGGRVAVPGGQGVFDLLLEQQAIDQFHLARAVGVKLPCGRPIFSGLTRGATLEERLAHAGLQPGPTITLDASAPVVLNVWQRV